MTDATEERSWQRRFLESSAAAGAAAPPMRGTPTRTAGWWQRPVIWPNWLAIFSKNEWHVRPIDADCTTEHHFDLADDQVLVPLQSRYYCHLFPRFIKPLFSRKLSGKRWRPHRHAAGLAPPCSSGSQPSPAAVSGLR